MPPGDFSYTTQSVASAALACPVFYFVHNIVIRPMAAIFQTPSPTTSASTAPWQPSIVSHPNDAEYKKLFQTA